MTNKIRIMLYNKRINKKGYPTVNIPDCIIEKYKEVCRKTKNMNNFDIYKKLNRIFFLSRKITDEKYKYGNLNITYSKENNTIINIENTYGVEVESKYCVRSEKKKKYNKIYEVENNGNNKKKRKKFIKKDIKEVV